MPYADVSDAILDSDVSGEWFQVIRRQDNVNSHGRNNPVQNTWGYNVTGSVQPTGDNSLVREEAYSTQMKSIQVITEFRIRGAAQDNTGQAFQPDLIFWKGGYYIVKDVKDYSQYGAGYVEAEAVSFDYNGPPPPPQTNQVGRWDFSQAQNSSLGKGNPEFGR